ncbi:MAG: homoserine dehydrogenase [Methanobacteriota archaeon]
MAEPRPFRILMAGYGTVGRALHRVLVERRDELALRYGFAPILVGIARRDRLVRDASGLPAGNPDNLPWKRGTAMDLIFEKGADCFVEVSPTNLSNGQPGLGHVRAALDAGLPCVLANKGPVAFAFAELRDRAAKQGVPLRFEATVAGAVPVFSTLRHGLAGDTVQRVDGILNGTSNFVLTRMAEEGSGLDQALKEAQALGYAEADPSADIDGLDAAAKIAILANAMLGRDVTFKDVEIQGIRGVSREAVELATKHGYRVKLVAEAARAGPIRVGPRLVPRGATLDVSGALNAVRVRSDLAGTVTHVGKGAGGRETAAALLSDIVDVATQKR